MSLVHEKITHQETGVTLMVSERQKYESSKQWRFVLLDAGCWATLTPRELRELGKWLQQQGRRLGKEYKSNGAPKKSG